MAEKTPITTRIPSVLEDPGTTAIARVYAQAFLDAIPVDQAAGTLEEFQSFVDDVLGRNTEFARLLTSAMVGRNDKLALIDRVIAGRGSELFANFLRVLARHDRLDLLPAILRQIGVLYETSAGRRRVQVTTARPLSPETMQKITDRLQAALPFQPVVEPTVDPAILGGLKIRVGDTVYDGSLRARLKQLRHRVRERSLHEIQSGRNRFSHQ